MKKIISFIILVTISLSIYSQYNFEKKPYILFQNMESEDPNINYSPELKDIMVRWQLDEPNTSIIRWGQGSYEFTEDPSVDPNDNTLYYYNFPLADLTEQTIYMYKVEINNGEEASGTFTTPPSTDETDVTFYAYGDTRGNSENGYPPYESDFHDEVCQQINSEINTDPTSQTFILHAGDWNYEDSEDYWKYCYFNLDDENAMEMLSKLPVMGVYGNHEMGGQAGLVYEKYWTYSYEEDNPTPYNRYYSFDYGPVHICCLHIPCDDWSITPEQLAWFTSDVSQTNKKWKILMFHTPGYSNGGHPDNLNVRTIVQPICEGFGVQLVIAGHNHYYAHWLVNGVHHLTLGGGGVEIGYGNTPLYDIGELKSFMFHHFAKINIENDVMDIIINSFDEIDNIWKSDFDSFTLPPTLKICDGIQEIWEEDITYVDEIRVCEGSTLTITSEVGFVENGKIIIERGGKLILDGGTVTNACDGLWKGVELWGTYNQSQSYTYQGAVEIINEGTIENAEIGIQTIKMSDIPPPGEATPDYTYTGGMVLADGGIFKNNRTAVKFWPYNHTSSLSFFRNCQFITDNELLQGTDPDNFIEMLDISGVKVAGSSFTDTHTVAEPDELTTGIEAYDARFYVWSYGEQPSLFTGLYDGIRAYSYNPIRTVNIENSQFTDNFRSIYISGMTNAVIESNDLSINSPYSNLNGGYGLYLDHSTAYKVEENNFYHEGGNAVGVGLIVNQSKDEPNTIYRNYFTNLECGMDIQGENRAKDGTGLELKCNHYEGTTWDKIIIWDSPLITENAGIASNQGSSSSNPEDMAGNLFQIDSQTPNGDFDDILNEANHITYYYPHNFEAGLENVKPVDYTDNVTLKEMEVYPDWSFNNGCPPSDDPGGGGGIDDTKGNMASTGQKIDSTENLLSMLIDGGNTEAVQTDVDNSIPPETMQVYNELMNKSPYLSDTVVSTAIEKEDVLPGAMIRDIMVANPKVAKSKKLMKKLDERWNPLPEYMKAQILQGRSIVSIREETESRLAAFKLKKAKYFNALVRYYLNDTVNPQASLDSLTALLQNENRLKAKYSLAMLSLEHGVWSEGLVVLNDIPTQFDLTAAEAEAHSQITTYYTLLSNIAQQGKSVFEADSAQIATLISMEANQSGMASVYARNILLALNQMEYEEPIILPDLLKSSAAMDEYKELLSKAADAPGYIKVKPNPAKDYIIIEYELEQEVEATIEINNISGNLKYLGNFTNRHDRFTVDTRKWKAGIYIATLKINDKLIESFKFTIID
ncbi:MAG: metallophosphoesterase [Bacteroidetes bacterium]|nr:metallophosphoesterase [Bacteroidota bacterium]MBL7102927.1 metallophosphoesterase [Bacteroidales bacterium]